MNDHTEPARSQFPLLITGPEDLLSAIPYMIGYHPSDDLVIVGLHHRDYTASFRCDLWPPGAPCPITPAMIRSTGIDTALIAAYGPADNADHALAHILGILPVAGVTPGEILSVTGNVYTDHRTAESSPQPIPVGTTAIAAGLVAAGYGALPDKQAFARHLDPVPGPFTTAVASAMRRYRDFAAAELQEWARMLLNVSDRLPGPVETAALVLAFADHDFAVAATAPVAPVAPGELTSRIPLLTHLLRHATGRYRAVPAALLADHAMRAGNGGLARLAIEHANAADRSDPLVQAVARRLATPRSRS